MAIRRGLASLGVGMLLFLLVPHLALSARSASQADVGQATLTVLTEQVTVVGGPSGTSHEGFNGEIIAAGDRVLTDAGGSAIVTFFDGSELELGANTEVLLQALGQTECGGVLVQIAQAGGLTIHRVTELGQQSNYQLQTPNTIALVRGTLFRALVERDVASGVVTRENLLVEDGEVEVRLRTQTRTLQPGQQLNVIPTGGGLEVVGTEPVIDDGVDATDGLKADYQFQNTLESTVAGAPPLSNLGENSFQTETVGFAEATGLAAAGAGSQARLADDSVRTVLAFPLGSGVALDSTVGVIPDDAYSIVMLFRFEEVNGYRMILDFKNGSGDIALYNYYGTLVFYTAAYGENSPITPNTWVQVVLTRDAARNVVGYVNGIEEFAFVDEAELATVGVDNNLRFFRDNQGVGIEHSAGAVARIRLYDRALSADEVAGLGRLP